MRRWESGQATDTAIIIIAYGFYAICPFAAGYTQMIESSELFIWPD